MRNLATKTCHIFKTCHKPVMDKTAGQRLGKVRNDRYDRYDRFSHITALVEGVFTPIYYSKNTARGGTSKNLSYLSCVIDQSSSLGYQVKPKTKPMPKWLKERIDEMITRVGELARPGVCPKCKSGVWVTAIPYPLKLDPEPLDARGELEALLAGCMTWLAKPILLTFWPIHRRAQDITNSRPNDVVLADHRCRELSVVDMPDYWPEKRIAQSTQSDGVCPF